VSAYWSKFMEIELCNLPSHSMPNSSYRLYFYISPFSALNALTSLIYWLNHKLTLYTYERAFCWTLTTILAIKFFIYTKMFPYTSQPTDLKWIFRQCVIEDWWTVRLAKIFWEDFSWKDIQFCDKSKYLKHSNLHSCYKSIRITFFCWTMTTFLRPKKYSQ
jgi:hypothetical protein